MSPDRFYHHNKVLIAETTTNYEKSIKKRISNAMRCPPVDGVFASNGKLLPYYKIGDNRNNEACAAHEACNHGFKNHCIPVVKNLFILSDIANVGIPDPILIPPVLLHDIVYGINGAQWKDSNIPNHQKMAVRYIEKVNNKLLDQLIDLTRERTRESLAILNHWAPMYRQTIESSTEEMIAYTATLDRSCITDAQLFPPLFCLADKLAYYDRNRVGGLQKHDDNSFFDYSYAVRQYQISQNNNTIVYGVVLDGMNFTEWYEGTRALYPNVWNLGDAVAGIIGKNFRVQEAIL